MLIATPSHHIMIDVDEFNALSREITGPGVAPPTLGVMPPGKFGPFRSVIALHDPVGNAIWFDEKEMGDVIREWDVSPKIATSIILAHEYGHFLCNKAPHVSRWSLPHNTAKWMMNALCTILPARIPVAGPGAAPWLLLDALCELREHSANKVGIPLHRQYRERFYHMIVVT